MPDSQVDQYSQSRRQVRNQILLWTSTPLLCWLWMQIIHECGHVLAVLALQGRVEHVDLHPMRISHTLYTAAPDATVWIIWSGPLLGCLFPLLIWGMITRWWQPAAHHFRFFAGFCLIANGAYLGSAVLDLVGDARDLVQRQVPLAALIVFAVSTVPAGFWLWNGLGPRFGLGDQPEPIGNWESTMALLLLFLTVVVEILVVTG